MSNQAQQVEEARRAVAVARREADRAHAKFAAAYAAHKSALAAFIAAEIDHAAAVKAAK